MIEGQTTEAAANEQNNSLPQPLAEHNSHEGNPTVTDGQSAANKQNKVTAETPNLNSSDNPPMEVPHPHHLHLLQLSGPG